jgi:hypothetical protein
MKKNPITEIVQQRLSSLGLTQIPTASIQYIEAQMCAEVRRIADRKLTARSVARTILKALYQPQKAPSFTLDTAPEPKP